MAGGIGSLATTPNIPTWYAGLEKAFFTPPNWVFGPVWTVLYVLMGIALYLAISSRTEKDKKLAYTLFGVQLALNTLWSVVFFGLHQLWLGVVVVVALWLTILATIWQFRRFSTTAAWLMVPYVVWVTYATILTISLASLNT